MNSYNTERVLYQLIEGYTFEYTFRPLVHLKGFKVYDILTQGEILLQSSSQFLVNPESKVALLDRIVIPRYSKINLDFSTLCDKFSNDFSDLGVEAIIAQYCSPHQSAFFRKLKFNETINSTFYIIIKDLTE